jgi:hypothetical protein
MGDASHLLQSYSQPVWSLAGDRGNLLPSKNRYNLHTAFDELEPILVTEATRPSGFTENLEESKENPLNKREY